MTKAKLVIPALLALVPATSGMARGLIIPGLKISDVLILIAGMLALIWWRASWRLSDIMGFGVFLYAFWHVITTLVNYAERPSLLSDVPLLQEILGGPQFLLIYLVAFACGQQAGILKATTLLSLYAAAGIAVIAILQILDVGPTRDILALVTGNPLLSTPLDWQTYRATGVFYSWHALGMYLAVNATFGIALYAHGRLEVRLRRRVLGLSILALSGTVAALTATPIVLVAAGVVIFSFGTRFARMLPALVVGILVLFLATPIGQLAEERAEKQANTVSDHFAWLPQTIGYRLTIWEQDYFPIIFENMWNGYGPLGSTDNDLFKYAESMYVLILLHGGILLLLALLFIMLVNLIKSVSIAKKSKIKHYYFLFAMASALSVYSAYLFVAQILHIYLSDAGSAQMFFLFSGLIFGAAELSRKSASAIEGELPFLKTNSPRFNRPDRMP